MAEAVRKIDLKKLKEANAQYLVGLSPKQLGIVYDSTLDAFFVELNEPKEALTEHVIDNVLVRVDPESLRILDLEIQDFFSDFLPNNRLFREVAAKLGITEGFDFEMHFEDRSYSALGRLVTALAAYVGEHLAGS